MSNLPIRRRRIAARKVVVLTQDGEVLETVVACKRRMSGIAAVLVIVAAWAAAFYLAPPALFHFGPAQADVVRGLGAADLRTQAIRGQDSLPPLLDYVHDPWSTWARTR